MCSSLDVKLACFSLIDRGIERCDWSRNPDGSWPQNHIQTITSFITGGVNITRLWRSRRPAAPETDAFTGSEIYRRRNSLQLSSADMIQPRHSQRRLQAETNLLPKDE